MTTVSGPGIRTMTTAARQNVASETSTPSA
jgi:hypothetical protein